MYKRRIYEIDSFQICRHVLQEESFETSEAAEFFTKNLLSGNIEIVWDA